MGWSTLSASLQVTPDWGEMVDVLESRTAIQRDLDRLEEWADWNLFNKSKYKSCI